MKRQNFQKNSSKGLDEHTVKLDRLVSMIQGVESLTISSNTHVKEIADIVDALLQSSQQLQSELNTYRT
jgi:hypothetical protein